MRVARMGTGVVAALVAVATATGCGGDDGASCPGEELGEAPLAIEVSEDDLGGPEGYAPEVTGVAVAPDGEVYFSLPYSVYCIAHGAVFEVITPNSTPFPDGEEESMYIDISTDPEGTPLVVDWKNPGVYAIDDRGLTLVPGTDAAEIGGSRSIAVGDDGTLFMTGLDHSGTTDVYAVSDGEVALFAGGGEYGHAGDGGPATESWLAEPEGLEVDTDGNLLIADRNNDRIAEVTPDGTIDTVLGGGILFEDREEDETLSGPNDLALDPDGQLYIIDGSHRLLRADGDDVALVSADGTSDCQTYLVTAADRAESDRIRTREPSCPIEEVDLSRTSRIAFDPDGALWMNGGPQVLRLEDGRVEVMVELSLA